MESLHDKRFTLLQANRAFRPAAPLLELAIDGGLLAVGMTALGLDLRADAKLSWSAGVNGDASVPLAQPRAGWRAPLGPDTWLFGGKLLVVVIVGGSRRGLGARRRVEIPLLPSSFFNEDVS